MSQRCKKCGERFYGTYHSCSPTTVTSMEDTVNMVNTFNTSTAIESAFETPNVDTSPSTPDFGGFDGGSSGGGGSDGSF